MRREVQMNGPTVLPGRQLAVEPGCRLHLGRGLLRHRDTGMTSTALLTGPVGRCT